MAELRQRLPTDPSAHMHRTNTADAARFTTRAPGAGCGGRAGITLRAARAFQAARSSSSSLSGAPRGSARMAATSRSVMRARVRAWNRRWKPTAPPPSAAATATGGGCLRFCVDTRGLISWDSARSMHQNGTLLYPPQRRCPRGDAPGSDSSRAASAAQTAAWGNASAGAKRRAVPGGSEGAGDGPCLTRACTQHHRCLHQLCRGARRPAHPYGPGVDQAAAGHDAPGCAPAGQRREHAVRRAAALGAQLPHALPPLRWRAEEERGLRGRAARVVSGPPGRALSQQGATARALARCV